MKNTIIIFSAILISLSVMIFGLRLVFRMRVIENYVFDIHGKRSISVDGWIAIKKRTWFGYNYCNITSKAKARFWIDFVEGDSISSILNSSKSKKLIKKINKFEPRETYRTKEYYFSSNRLNGADVYFVIVKFENKKTGAIAVIEDLGEDMPDEALRQSLFISMVVDVYQRGVERNAFM